MDQALIVEKVAQATRAMDELDLDLWLTLVRETTLAPDPVLPLIAGLDFTWQTALMIDRAGRHRAIVGHFDAADLRRLGVYEVTAYHEGISEPLRAVLNELNPRRIAVNSSRSDVAADGLSHGLYLALEEYLAGTPFAARLTSAEALIAAVRGRKSPAEIALMRAAVTSTLELFDEVERAVRPGMTARQIQAFVHDRVDALGLGYAWPRPFNPIVTCGPDSPIGHAAPGDVVLQPGHTLHLDLGVRQDGYCSDLQRMWYVLDDGEERPPDDVQHAFDAVRAAIEAGARALRPGAIGVDVDAAARRELVARGYPEFMHAFGHLLGRAAHDGATVLGPPWERYEGLAQRRVEAGNVFTLELHVPVPGRGIMSLEEDALVTATGLEYLGPPQTALRVLRP